MSVRSMHSQFPVIHISKAGTVEELLVDDARHLLIYKEKKLVYSSFENLRGEKILVIHGNERGVFPKESREAIAKFNPRFIYCCYPKSCRWANADERIVGEHDEPTYYRRQALSDGRVIFTLTLEA